MGKTWYPCQECGEVQTYGKLCLPCALRHWWETEATRMQKSALLYRLFAPKKAEKPTPESVS